MHLVIVAPSSGQLGGMEVYVFRAAEVAIAGLDSRVTICLKRTRRHKMHPELARAIAESSAEVIVVERSSRELAGLLRSADLVHAQNYSADVGLLTRLLHKPLLVTVHGHRPNSLPLRMRLGELASRRAVERWYNSYFTWDSWEPQERRATSRLISMRPDVKDTAVPVDERIGFIFAGRWIANKGLETLVEAYAQADLDRAIWPLTLLGDGPLRPSVLRRIDELGMTVHAPGFVDEVTRQALFRSTRWMVTPPETREDLGLTPLEARALGIPCIASRDGGVPEAAGCFGLLFEPGNVRELCALLEFAASQSVADYARFSTGTLAMLNASWPPMSAHAAMYAEVDIR